MPHHTVWLNKRTDRTVEGSKESADRCYKIPRHWKNVMYIRVFHLGSTRKNKTECARTHKRAPVYYKTSIFLSFHRPQINHENCATRLTISKLLCCKLILLSLICTFSSSSLLVVGRPRIKSTSEGVVYIPLSRRKCIDKWKNIFCRIYLQSKSPLQSKYMLWPGQYLFPDWRKGAIGHGIIVAEITTSRTGDWMYDAAHFASRVNHFSSEKSPWSQCSMTLS